MNEVTSAANTLEPASDRRRAERIAFPFRQRVAPYRDGLRPLPRDFQEVELHDLSSHGVVDRKHVGVLEPPAIHARRVRQHWRAVRGQPDRDPVHAPRAVN